MTDLAVPGVSYVEANWGCWVARCMRPWCTNAMQVEPGDMAVTCVGLDGCGYVSWLAWPPDPQAIVAILMMRPVRRTRNWLPGETIADLMGENAAHGLIPPEWIALAEATPGGILAAFETRDEVLVGGLLHKELVAAGRLEIGA